MCRQIGKKVLSALLSATLILSCLFSGNVILQVEAEEGYSTPTIEVVGAEVSVGAEFDVLIKVYNNTEISGMTLSLEYDESSMELLEVAYNSGVPGFTNTRVSSSPMEVSAVSGMVNYTEKDYTFATLTFKALDNVGVSTLQCTYDPQELFSVDMETFVLHTFVIVNGTVTITDTIDTEVALDGSISTPEKATTASASLIGDNVDVEVTWSPELVNGTTFAASTIYSATITVTADDYYTFGSEASITYSDYEFTKEGDTFIATKTFDKTEAKALIGLEVTEGPDVTSCVDGEEFDTAGMVVKATYDDGTVDADYQGYTVKYENGGEALVKGETSVILSSGTTTTTVTGLTVAGKEATSALFNCEKLAELGLVYDGSNQLDAIESAITVAGDISSRGAVAYTYTTTDGTSVSELKDAGTYCVYATLEGGTEYDALTITKIGEVTIAKKSISESDFTLIDVSDQVYTADQIKPDVTSSLTATDYTVSYGANKNVVDGGTITITGEGNYRGTIEKSFTITPIVITADDFEYTSSVSKIYDGTADCNITEVELKDGVLSGSDTLDIVGTAKYNSANVSDAVKVTFIPEAITEGNYILESTEIFDISASILAYTNIEDTTSSTSNVVVGDGTFPVPSFVGVGNEEVTGTTTYTYNGEVMTYSEIKAELAKLAKGATATVSYQFTGSGNYEGASEAGTITITIVDIQFAIGVSAATADNSVTVDEDALVYGNSWSDILSINDAITATVNGYGDEGTGTFSIAETGNPNAGTQTYTVLYSGTINGKTYTDVTVCTGSIVVEAKELTESDLVYTGAGITKVYDATTTGGNATVSVKETVLVEGDTLGTINAAYYYNSPDVKDAAYAIITTTEGISGGNYILASELTITVAATITPMSVEVEIGDIGSVVYDGNAQEPKITLINTPYTYFTADDYSVSYSNNLDVGEANATVSPVEDSNYTFTRVTKTFEIEKAIYDGAKDSGNATRYGNEGSYDIATDLVLPTGYVLGTISVEDNDNVLEGTVVLDGTTLSYEFVSDKENVDKVVTVTIPVTSTNYKDYELSVTLTVASKLTQDGFQFAETAISKTYGDASFELEIEGMLSSNGIAYVSDNEDVISIKNGVATIVGCGTATITATAFEGLVYTEATATQTITVSKMPITVTADDVNVLLGDAMPEFTYTMTDLAYGDVVTVEATMATSAVDTATAGSYNIEASNLEVENSDYYEITYVAGVLKVVLDTTIEGEESTSGEDVSVENDEVVDTGDNTPFMPLFSVLFVSFIGIVVLFIKRKEEHA